MEGLPFLSDGATTIKLVNSLLPSIQRFGKKVAVHPLAKPAIQNGTATDKKSEIDGNFFTAQDENTIWTMMPQVIEALK